MEIDYKNELNKEQYAAVEGGDGPTLVLAGAGSGKTRTIIYRVAWLLEKGASQDEILLVTFTNKAAKEMTERLAALLNVASTGLWAGTFHSIANRILRKHAHRLGYNLNFTILDQDDSKSLIKNCIKEAKIKTAGRRFPSPAILQGIMSFSRNASLSLNETIEKMHPAFVEMANDIERIEVMYKRKKSESNSMDFDDLLLNLQKLLEENTDIEDTLAEQFKYILVDEYQDTNALQANIVARLAKKHRNVLVVGDDAQSIYSFRAADIQNILRFPSIFTGAQTHRLEINYRSTPEILSLANESISNNSEQFEKTLKPAKETGNKPRVVAVRTPREEAIYIADEIMSALEGGLPADMIAVLFRAAYQSQALEFELMKRGITYDYRGGMRFFERAHIKDVLAVLRVIDNPKDEASWMRLLGIQTGVGPVAAQKIFKIVRDLEPEQWITAEIETTLPKRSQNGWHQAKEIIEQVLEKNSISERIRAVAGSNYNDYLSNQYTNAAERVQDIDQLALFADQYTDLAVFLEEVTLSDKFGSEMENTMFYEPKVILSTIHQAKGLEWDIVFVISLTDGSFPNRRAIEDDGDIQEERRLFYVAVTRAKKALHMTVPLYGMGNASYQALPPSMFIQEISEELYDKIGNTSGNSRLGSYSNRSQKGYIRPKQEPEDSINIWKEDDTDQGGFKDDYPDNQEEQGGSHKYLF